MRLRNKKTGEIREWQKVGVIDYGELNEVYDAAEYNSLAELIEEWEDCEEPFWYISQDGLIYSDNASVAQDGYIDRLRLVGNYFESKEEAEKAVEKLKAWKRLKDAGCKFVLDDNLVVRFVTPNATKIETAEQQKSLSDDYKLLFGVE